MRNLLKVTGFLPYLAIAFLNASVDLAHKITIQNVLLKTYSGDTLFILTAVINAMILLPFIFLFSPSSFINDKFAKTKVIRICAVFGVVISVAVLISYLLGAFGVAFALTLILAAQSAIYSPAKYGIIKALVGTERLGTANGVIQALTIVAILVSSFLFSFIFENLYIQGENSEEILKSVYPIGIFLVVFSALEAFFAYKLPYISETNEQSGEFELKRYISLSYLRENLKEVRSDKNIWLSIAGLSIFWGISQIIIAAFPAHYKAVFNDDSSLAVQAILAVSAIGIAFGSYVAGSMSKLHIELGIVPMGAIGIFFSLLFFAFGSSIGVVSLSSFAFGFFGGIFIVPLNAMIQYFAPQKSTGKIMAANNFLQNVSMLLFLAIGIGLVYFEISTTGLFVFTALVCLIGSFYAILQLPHLFTRLLLLPFLKTKYRFFVEGLQNLPQSGGALLLGNHISWIDWLVLQAASPRGIRFVMYRTIYNKWYLKQIFKFFKVIPIGAGASKESIELVRECLKNGEVVALFPEGHISYNGQINEFQKGFELIIRDLEEICIVPFYLRGLWGSSFSRASKFYKDLTSKNGRRDIIVAFGKPITTFINAAKMKQKVLELSFSSWESFISRQKPLTSEWLNNAKESKFKECVSDSTGLNLSNLKFITAVLVFIKIFKRELKDEKNIGILLPSSSIAAIVNMALLAMGKVSVNLNYTLNETSLNHALRKANINTVITSSKFLEKLALKGFDLKDAMSGRAKFAEDLSASVSKKEKFLALLTAFFAPAWLIKLCYFRPVSLEDTATILFSSGSEGEPKGIELSHKNLLANIKQISELLNFKKDDVILNSLPVFHSFGLTVTTLMPLCEGIKMVSVPDPTDGATIGKMAARHSVSIIFGTSTFFRLYTRNKKLHPLMFQSARMVVAGAEKLKPEIKDEFRLKFGIEIYEGYGATETAPVAAVNMPNILEKESLKELTFNRPGSVGMPLPGTIIKIIDPETLEELETGTDGLIVIGGSQVMKGYLNDEAKTSEVITHIDGVRYYKTGDKGHIDENGFVFIVDRYSRFAKIGGEMISLGSVEEELAKVLGGDVVFSSANVPDSKKGEAIALLVKSGTEPENIEQILKESNLAPIMMPSYIFIVDDIPTLASGKVDFKGVKALAVSLLAE